MKFRQGKSVTRVSNEVRPGGKYNYVKVTDGTNTGWVAKEFLVEKEEDCGPLNEQVVCTSEGGDLYVRGLNSNGTVGNKKAEFPHLAKVQLQNSGTKQRSGLDYVEVKSGDVTGWVAKKFLTESKDKCPTKNLGGDSSAPAGSFVRCMQREMPKMTDYWSCGQNGKCSKPGKPRGKSTAMCARYLKAGVLRCGGSRSYIGCAQAKNCGPGFAAAGFKKLSHRDPRKAPMGAIVIYGSRCGHPAGHIEVKAANNQWISDFIARAPANELRPSCRPVRAIYYKP